MNGDEFGSIKLLKLKYRNGDQKTETFYSISSPQKLGPNSLICRNVRSLTKALLNDTEHIQI